MKDKIISLWKPLFFIYFISMVIYPIWDGNGDFLYVQEVWHCWQSFNAGVLLFLSALIALESTIKIEKIKLDNEKTQRERNFAAARAFLPDALSELTAYCRCSAELLKEAWDGAAAESANMPLKNPVPKLPTRYAEVFAQCIGFAEPEVGKHLAHILVRLQVQNARINQLSRDFSESSAYAFVPNYHIMQDFYDLAELQALINKTFGYARASDIFDNSELIFENYVTAYFNLDINFENYNSLREFTEKRIESKNGIDSRKN